MEMHCRLENISNDRIMRNCDSLTCVSSISVVYGREHTLGLPKYRPYDSFLFSMCHGAQELTSRPTGETKEGNSGLGFTRCKAYDSMILPFACAKVDELI